MTSRTLTVVLAATAAAFALLVAVILLHRPQPSTHSSTSTATSVPAAAPTNISTPGPPAEKDPSVDGGPGDLPSSEVQDHSDAMPGNTTPYSHTAEARRQWQPIVTGFGQAFTTTEGKTARQWRAGLSPYVTSAVRQQLATVDLRNVPAGVFTGIEVAEYGDDKVAVFLHYDSGLTFVAYLILDRGTWRIYAYDRWED